MATAAPVSEGFAATVVRWLVRKRVSISLVVFTALVSFDVVSGLKPRDLTNYREVWSIISIAMVLAGLAVRSWAAGTLIKSKVLATTGPYRLIRNPLYLGSFLMMGGFCLLIGDPRTVAILLGPIVILYLVAVRHEEKFLAKKFGNAWKVFADRTPRFIPRSLSFDTRDWNFAQWRSSREYQAVFGTLIAFAAIKLWQLY